MGRGSRRKAYLPRPCWSRLVILRLYEAYPIPLTVKELAKGVEEWSSQILTRYINELRSRGFLVRVARSLYTLSDEYKQYLDRVAEELGGRGKLLEHLRSCVNPDQAIMLKATARRVAGGTASTAIIRVRFTGSEASAGSRNVYCSVCNMFWVNGVKVSTDSKPRGRRLQPIRNILTLKMASAAVRRLSLALNNLYDGTREVVVSRARILAMTYLAAARAGVNPVHVKTVFPTGTAYHIDHMLEGFARVKVGLVGAFTPLLHTMSRLNAETGILGGALNTKVVDSREIINGGVELWRPLEVLHSLASMTSEHYDPLAAATLHYLINSTKDAVEGSVAAVKRGLAGVPDTLREAAGEARDPDVKRLAEILASLAEKAYELADYTGNLIRDLRDATLRMASQGGYTEARARILGRLREAINYTRATEDHINQLASEGSRVIQQLRGKHILLSVSLGKETESPS